MEERIIEIMKEVLGEENIDVNTTQESSENWTSLRHLNLVSELEDEFDVDIDPGEVAKMKSVIEIVDVIRSKMA